MPELDKFMHDFLLWAVEIPHEIQPTQPSIFRFR